MWAQTPRALTSVSLYGAVDAVLTLVAFEVLVVSRRRGVAAAGTAAASSAAGSTAIATTSSCPAGCRLAPVAVADAAAARARRFTSGSSSATRAERGGRSRAVRPVAMCSQ